MQENSDESRGEHRRRTARRAEESSARGQRGEIGVQEHSEESRGEECRRTRRREEESSEESEENRGEQYHDLRHTVVPATLMHVTFQECMCANPHTSSHAFKCTVALYVWVVVGVVVVVVVVVVVAVAVVVVERC